MNAALNHRIRYRFDTAPSGDYWATANETLARSAGDCEDFVIAKMQALRDLGIAPQDLYMTIGNDVAAGSVHAVLLVRRNQGFWVLDNRTDKLIPQEQFRDFYPILTFSAGRTWVHGYRGAIPAPVRAIDIARASRAEQLALGNSAGNIVRIRAR